MREEWYGWQTLLADAGAIAFAVGTVNKIEGYALVPFFLAAPGVHVAHARPLTGLGSVGLRVGLPLAGGFTGIALGAFTGACDRGSDDYDDTGWAETGCILGSGALGFLLGVTAAIIVDAGVLAYEKPKERSRKATTGLRLAPTAALGRNHASVGLSGSF